MEGYISSSHRSPICGKIGELDAKTNSYLLNEDSIREELLGRWNQRRGRSGRNQTVITITWSKEHRAFESERGQYFTSKRSYFFTVTLFMHYTWHSFLYMQSSKIAPSFKYTNL